MTSYTTLSLVCDPQVLGPTENQIREVLGQYIDLADSFEAGQVESSFDVNEHGLKAWCNTRWSVNGISAACQALSAAFPLGLVETREEWDTGDADEPGMTGQRWRGGRLVALGESEFRWQEV